MKKHSVFISILSAVVGGLLVTVMFLECVMPKIYSNMVVDVQNIELLKGEKSVDYADILEEYQLARLYLEDPMYFYKRKKGYRILEELSGKGYTPAAVSLNTFHAKQMNYYASKKDIENFAKQHSKTHYWALVAAKQGDYVPLMSMVKHDALEKVKGDISEELILLDKWVQESSLSTAPKIMAAYYEKVGNKEKAAKLWAEYEQRKQNPLSPPACTTITPWRGF